MFTMGAMKTYRSAQTFGFFDVELRVQWLEAKGNPLSRLDAVINWESFRPLLAQALAKPAKGPGGRPANDSVKMFKLLVVQRYYNLSDEQTEYQVSDRLSFQKFVGWTVTDKVPDANTLWDFREALVGAGVFEKLFEQFAQQLQARGLLAQEGKLVDASFVDVPRQRNSRAENATIQAGTVPEAWAEQPAKQRQKDVDARWTKKNAEVHYGYKNHVKADAASKLIEKYAVTDASVHDSQLLAPLVAPTEGAVYADSSYRHAAAIGFINLIYNLARYEQIERLKLLPLRAV